MNEIRAKKSNRHLFVRYAILPGFIPRILDLFSSGFKTLAFYIATIFGAVRILKPGHPYLQRGSYQKFGLINVLAEGSRHVTWDRRHIDQIAVYLMVMTSFIVLLMQFVIMGLVFLGGSPAFAIPNDMTLNAGDFDFFFTPTVPEQDYALRFLDLVFGLPDVAGTGGFFESCIGTATTCNDYRGNPILPGYSIWPMPMHVGFHSMIEFYNYTIIGLAFVIIMYYFVTMAAETTVHGTFWGRRGNKTWIPIRIIFFAALIMPFYQGFNLGQILTLNAAYFGTGMASNAWRELNTVIADELAGQHNRLVAGPNRSNFPSSKSMVEFMSIAKTCAYSESQVNGRKIDAYIVKDTAGALDNCLPLATTTYDDALTFSNNQDIRIRFGERVRPRAADGSPAGDPVDCSSTAPADYANMGTEYALQAGFVIPYCGELTLTQSGPRTMSEDIRRGHYDDLVQFLWADTDIDDLGRQMTESSLDETVTTLYEPDFDIVRTMIQDRDTQIATNIDDAVANLLASPYFDIEASLGSCGWLCAAIYYNRIADANGDIQTSVFNMPELTLWPSVTETVLAERNKSNRTNNICELFDPVLPGRQPVQFAEESNFRVAGVISNTHEFFCNRGLINSEFEEGGTDAFRYTMSGFEGQPLKAWVANIFGINGLFDMREHTDIHPLAQLSILGKGMVESTIRLFGFSAIGSMGTSMGLQNILSEGAVSTIKTLSSVMVTFGMIGLTTGFILYYVLPFLPFVYFMCAAMGWVKSIFEAMVGLPLWALAHLRLDGEGIPGDGAASGYWLIVEILIRPILIVAGLLASIAIFVAMVKVLNDMFDLVVGNVGGYNAINGVSLATGGPTSVPDPYALEIGRGPIDQFFYTIIYAIIVYMIAMSSFKLVDLIPNQILRWAGISVSTFGDFAGDPASGLMGFISQGITATAVIGSGALGKMNDRNTNVAGELNSSIGRNT